MDSLVFLQKFPFTEKARNYLKESKVSLEDVSEVQVKKAALLISRASSGSDYFFELSSPSKEVLENEVIAFPVAKLIISNISVPNIIEKFSDLFRKKTFNELVSEKKVLDLMLLLADDFKISYDLFDENTIIVPLLQFLDIYFVDPETKLINKRVEKGKVFLNINDFARFLSEKTYKKIFDSLPIKKELIPKKFVVLSKNISPQLSIIQQKNYNEKLSGKIRIEFFPPSILNLYNKQLAGEKLSYLERLTIGGFLQQIGMHKSEMLLFFSKSPDYKKHIAEYHINRIYDVGLSAPSYKKMSEYGIIVSKEEQKYSHPVRYYIVQLRISNKKNNSQKFSKNISNGDSNV